MTRHKEQEKEPDCLKSYTMEEVALHTALHDRWLVVDNLVYDVSKWQSKHPGGARIIGHFAGQDATDAWVAMHPDKNLVSKYMKSLLIGRLEFESSQKDLDIVRDFRDLRATVEETGLLQPSLAFFISHFVHIILLEIIAYSVLKWFGVGWIPYLISAVLLTTAQAQSGWCQHDYGHLSVLSSSKLNHLMHYIVIGHLKGASSHWWNFRHSQHHVKPNTVGKDPDISFPYILLLGDKMPSVWAKHRRGVMPYNWQHVYFWLIGPPLLLPVYFHYENLLFIYRRKDWVDLAWMFTFFIRFFYLYGPLLGAFGAFSFYMFIRFLESHWFTLVTQMNHIPMQVDKDHNDSWLKAQVQATCNVEPSYFNNWFTGHLNFQIEHHLFPTMPRHNYYKVAPLVKSLLRKHGLEYTEKSLCGAVADIHRSLQKSGLLWLDAYRQL